MVILEDYLEASMSSSSSSTPDQKFDIFLSFRGIDTRRAFTAHLHKALEGANLNTFLDDREIETGLYLKPELESAIKASRASVIVLSKNYATSTWCLEELVLILEQHTDYNQIVIPIFYHVEPTNLRKQQNSFGDAMAEHKKKMEAETNVEKKSQWANKIAKWEKALTQVADLKGKDAKDYKLETEFIDEIVREIYRRLSQPLRTNLPKLTGREDSIEYVTSWLKDGSSLKADILTLSGMGGIGKTSVARYVYVSHCREFDRSSFINDIGRTCVGKFNGLLDLQKQLCGDIAITGPIDQVHDVLTYTSTVENALASKKVFLVLDDINSLEQLNALLGNKGFHPGSKVIITTKDMSLTERCVLFNPQVQPKHTKHLLKGLLEKASRKLLCANAFNCEDPEKGYEDVADNIVEYCDGHPLALEVLGSSLRNRQVAYWEDHIEGLKKESTPAKVDNVLRMSFDTLESENDKKLLKHIACFFVGEDRDYAETILKACDIKTSSGIANLIDRCLLHIGLRNQLTMHSLIQKMGRDEVDKESPDPEMRSLLWRHQDSYKVLKKNKGTGKIKGLSLDMRMIEKDKLRGSLFEMETDALSKMDNLKLLQLNLVQLNGSYKNYFPHKLRWLCMRCSPLEFMPSDLPMKKLVALDLSYSNIRSFDISFSNPQRPGKRQKLIGSSSKDEKLLGSLKILDLSYCDQLRRLGGFGELPALEKLLLRNCKSLVDVSETIGQCDELLVIDLSYCAKCNMFLRNLGILKNVKTLLLDGCNLGELPSETRDMDSVKTVDANNIGIASRTFSSASVEAIPREFKSLVISLPRLLVRLSLENNNLANESFPIDFSCLCMLKELILDNNPIISMPKCVRSLPGLEVLSMNDCKMLMSIKHPPHTLRVLNFWTTNQMLQLQRIVFDTEMSPLVLSARDYFFRYSSVEIKGMVKIQPVAGVEEKVLCSLCWSNLDFIKKRCIGIYDYQRGLEEYQTQMYYEFGIFSTIYGGKEMPNWISQASEGASISFTIPSSPKKKQLRGLNFCNVQRSVSVEKKSPYEYPVHLLFFLPPIEINNKTKSRTWIYVHCIDAMGVNVGGEWLTYLSHWMFGKGDEMGAGDEITITVKDRFNSFTKECGVSFVYEEDGSSMEEEEEEEDGLGYYKAWNHIIGGDLSFFQLTTGEYLLSTGRFLLGSGVPYFPGIPIKYKETEGLFKALSQRKSNILVRELEDVAK